MFADSLPPVETAIVQTVENQYINYDELSVYQIADEIRAVFADGFQWSDLGKLGSIAYTSVNKYLALPEALKKEAVIKIINIIIDTTDTPFLPDVIFDPILKQITPSFVSLFFSDEKTCYLLEKMEAEVNDALFLMYAEKIISSYDQVDEWHEIIPACKELVHCLSFYNLTPEQKQVYSQLMLDKIFDSSSASFLRRLVISPLHKNIAISFVMEAIKF